MAEDKTFKHVDINGPSNKGRVIRQAHYPSNSYVDRPSSNKPSKNKNNDNNSTMGLMKPKSLCAKIINVIAILVIIAGFALGIDIKDGDYFIPYFFSGIISAIFIHAYAIIVDACCKYLKS